MKEEQLTVAILAGGDSTRFGGNKALAKFNGKPLLEHIIGIADHISSRVLVVVSENGHSEAIKEIAGSIEVVTDPDDAPKCALTGALTAFEFSERKNTLLLPVDAPLVSSALVSFLVQLIDGHGAIVPRWPNGFIEPLHSVYLTEHAYYHGMKLMDDGKKRMSELIRSLKNVLSVSTEVLKKFDPDLHTFVNFNTQDELKALDGNA